MLSPLPLMGTSSAWRQTVWSILSTKLKLLRLLPRRRKPPVVLSSRTHLNGVDVARPLRKSPVVLMDGSCMTWLLALTKSSLFSWIFPRVSICTSSRWTVSGKSTLEGKLGWMKRETSQTHWRFEAKKYNTKTKRRQTRKDEWLPFISPHSYPP